MLRKKLIRLKEDLSTFNSKDKVFISSAMVCLFFIALEYAITRPASTSLFLHYYGAKNLSTVWLMMVPINFGAVYAYNYFLPRIGCIKVWGFISVVVVIINLSCCFFLNHFALLSFFQFIWKDIYILFMYKQIWSLIHSTLTYGKAKYIYSIIFAAGGIGSAVGGLFPSFLATSLGSSSLFSFTLPIYVLSFYFYVKSYKNSGYNNTLKKENPIFPYSKNSKYVLCILFLVVFIQISIAFVDYQYNSSLEKIISDIDQRTEFTGRISSIIHMLMMSFQLIGSVLIINFLGLKKTHYIIPLTLGINAVLFIFRPSLMIISYLFIYLKTLDYSLFSVIKEMLYLPMNTEEKFKAKSFIDIFAYRTAKAFAASIILLVNFTNHQKYLSFFSLIVFVLWMFTVNILYKTELSEIKM